MAYYKLVKSGRFQYDEVVIARGEDGEATKSISTVVATELSDEDVAKLRSQGFTVAETDQTPEVVDEGEQQVGADVEGMSPLIGASEGQQPEAVADAVPEPTQTQPGNADPNNPAFRSTTQTLS